MDFPWASARSRHLAAILLVLLAQPGWPPTCSGAGAGAGASASAVDADADCPSGCACVWRDGKETTECADLGLDAIPPGVAPGTQVLDLRGNGGIRELGGRIFLRLGLTNLQKIFLQDCSVSSVGGDAFARLTNLVELDLSGNQLGEVPSVAWSQKMALMRLKMARNPIKLIRRYYKVHK